VKMRNRVIAMLFLAACSDDAAATDAAPSDASALDATDAPPGPCGTDRFLTGEYVSWDSTPATFAGIPFAQWTVRGEPSRTATTNPNGRLELCIGNAAISVIDIAKAEFLPAIFVADPDVYAPTGTYFSAKSFSTARARTFYESVGLTFDAQRGHVLVQKQGTAIPLTLSAGGASFAVDDSDDTTWTAGNTGGLVLFANIDLTSATHTMLTSSTPFVGASDLPLEPGTLTITSIR
jgi:hypothetical protein